MHVKIKKKVAVLTQQIIKSYLENAPFFLTSSCLCIYMTKGPSLSFLFLHNQEVSSSSNSSHGQYNTVSHKDCFFSLFKRGCLSETSYPSCSQFVFYPRQYVMDLVFRTFRVFLVVGMIVFSHQMQWQWGVGLQQEYKWMMQSYRGESSSLYQKKALPKKLKGSYVYGYIIWSPLPFPHLFFIKYLKQFTPVHCCQMSTDSCK